MASKEDWIVGGIIIAALAALGITIYVLHRRKISGQKLQLKKISDGRPILSNLERVHLVRDRDGNLRDLVIRREIHE